RYNAQYERCQEPAPKAQLEEALRKVTGRTWHLRVELETGSPGAASPAPVAEDPETPQSRSRRQRTEAMQTPLLKRAVDTLEPQMIHMDEGFGGAPTAGPGQTVPVEES